MPASVRVILLDHRGLLFYDLSPSAGAGHGRAKEHVDDEHEEKEEAEGYAEVE